MRTTVPGKQQRTDHGKINRRRALWWLHPRFAFLFFGIPLLIGAYLIPDNTYLTLYRTEKYVDLDFLVLGSIICIGFVAGSFFAFRTGVRPQEKDILLYCRWVVWPLFIFTIFGYVTWFAYAVASAGGVGPIAGALFDLVSRSSPGASDYLKNELFQNLPGITTFTQLGILYATVEALLWSRGRSQVRLALMRFAVVALLTLLRAILLSERLALVEIAIPVAVILVSGLNLNVIRYKVLRFAPLILGVVVFGLFAVAEYFRSWVFYQQIYSGSYLEFAVQRFLGYYATAVNNAAVVYYYEPLQPLRHTLTSLFNFPVLGDNVERAYVALLDYMALLDERYVARVDGEYVGYARLLGTYANPEFNNVAPVGLLLNEYSVFVAPIVAFLIGLLSCSLYNSFLRGRLLGALLYPSWFVGVLEISRIYYWVNQRYFPVLAFLVISLLLFRAAKVPVKKPPSGRGRSRRMEGALERR